VEFGIIAPAFLLLLFGAIECGQMLWTQSSLQFAVEQAARCAVVNKTQCGTPSQIESYAASMVYGQSLSSSVFSATSAGCGTQVTASLPFTVLVIPITVTLAASSCRPG
jgi:Flp pilus assembly protein TadG